MDQLAKNVHLNDIKTKEYQREYWKAFWAGLTILFFTTFGDKIFFLNMIYASMNKFFQSFWIVLAISEIMNFLNLSLGQLISFFIPLIALECISVFIFLIFGICLIFRGCLMKEQPLIKQYEENRQRIQNNNENNENSNYRRVTVNDDISGNEEEIGVYDTWWKYFLTYFFTSIGDKSSLATIIISTRYNYFGLLTGTTFAILLLVLISMIFGKSLAKLLTNKQISIIAGIMFITFAGYFFVNKRMLNYFY